MTGVGVRPIMMYDIDRVGGLIDLDIMVKFRHETHKMGEVLAWKCEFGYIVIDFTILNCQTTPLLV